MGADPALDAQQRTKRFYMSAVSAQNVLRADLSPAQGRDSPKQPSSKAITSNTVQRGTRGSRRFRCRRRREAR